MTTAPDYAQNLDLFRRVANTDTAFTKYLKNKGGRTSTDTYYLITKAIAELGPIGTGFGWDIQKQGPVQAQGAAPESTIFVVEIIFWYGDRGNKINTLGSWPLFETVNSPQGDGAPVEKIKRIDDEAPVKALTRAISKALSYLGFSADVHLGCHDIGRKPEEQAKKAAAQRHLINLLSLPDQPAAPLQDFCSPSAAPRPAAAPPPPPPVQEEPKPPTSAQLEEIEVLLEKTGVNVQIILDSYKVKQIDHLSHKQAESALKRLRLTEEQKTKAAVPA